LGKPLRLQEVCQSISTMHSTLKIAPVTAVLLTSELIRDYLLNYARPLIFTTSLSYANIVLADCAFDLLEDGTVEPVRCTCHPPGYF
jgi:7-keto-8-aminopelargonate synthetase-like enzyme